MPADPDAARAFALAQHARYRGKIQIMPKCPIEGPGDFAVWYTPGVAVPCRAIEAAPERIGEFTNRGNSVAIVTDGSRVLGLGDIGPGAGLPVMEGKALLFKYLGDVDAVPVCLATQDAEEIIRTVQLLQPSFGAVNLEDISQPRCFQILDRLREVLEIPVWHDDQQGTATVVLAAVLNALRLVGKELAGVRIALLGFGAANVAVYRLLTSAGADPQRIVAVDSRGILHAGRDDIAATREHFYDKWRVCTESNAAGLTGGLGEALAGADLCIAFSSPQPGLIRPEWVRDMAKDACVFACANPEPEIWPEQASAAGARIVATGRGDYPNQVNNSLAFPGIFRGVLDVGASRITESMTVAAAHAIAERARRAGLRDDAIVPRMDDPELAAEVAAATAVAAVEAGVAATPATREAEFAKARGRIKRVQEATALLAGRDLLASPPD